MSSGIQKEFSADVTLNLVVEGRWLPLTRIGPGYAVLRSPENIPPGTTAVIFLAVDGREHQWHVVLPHGSVPFDHKFFFRTTRGPEQSLFNPFLS
ncbi:MAG TPA: hypothetical protein VKU82_05345 [Planctomycetaceae bacterium]|nr:hypothetical protein [Planctomycetaceae bacterium]